MKKNRKQIVCAILACIMMLWTPASAFAAETDEVGEIVDFNDNETNNGADNSDVSNNGDNDADNSDVSNNGNNNADNSDVSNNGNNDANNSDTNNSGNNDAGNSDTNGGNPGNDAQPSAQSDGENTPSDNEPLNQQGEVTEPITKEDKPYLALGADLTAQQQATVLGLLGVNPAELSEYDMITVTNDEEHKYLGNYVAASKIGTRSLSSVLVVKREQGHGINITTKNISYCTIGMYKNALITAGITDADIIVAGPFPISGTAALVGAMKAYSVMTGEEVSQESMDAALNELVFTGDLAEVVGDSEKAEELIAYLKSEIIEQDLESEEDIRAAIERGCEHFDITLSEDEIQQLINLLQKIGDLNLDWDSIRDQAEELYDKIADMDIDASGIWDKIVGFFRSIVDFFKGLFS